MLWQCRRQDPLVLAESQSLDEKNSAEQAERIENYFYESLAFFRHSVDLEYNEEVMKPERFKEAPDHADFTIGGVRVRTVEPRSTVWVGQTKKCGTRTLTPVRVIESHGARSARGWRRRRHPFFFYPAMSDSCVNLILV